VNLREIEVGGADIGHLVGGFGGALAAGMPVYESRWKSPTVSLPAPTPATRIGTSVYSSTTSSLTISAQAAPSEVGQQ